VNWLDGVIIAVFLWFTFAAFQAGFIREIVTIIAALIGIILAGLFYEELANDVLVFVGGDNSFLDEIVAFGVIFFACALAGQLLALLLKPTIGVLQLGIFDQLAGAAFGFAKAMIFVQIFLIVFVTYPRWGVERAIDDSFFGSLILDNGAVLVTFLPETFEEHVDGFTSGLQIPP
jgi:membrane protein required for colicin V production